MFFTQGQKCDINKILEAVDCINVAIADPQYLKLKNNKSSCIDGISNKCFKKLLRVGVKHLTNIFNACLKLRYFPDCEFYEFYFPCSLPVLLRPRLTIV